MSEIPEVFLLWVTLTSLFFFASPQGARLCASQTFHVCSCSDSLVVVSWEHSCTVNSLILPDAPSSESSARAWCSPLGGTDRAQLLCMCSLSSADPTPAGSNCTFSCRNIITPELPRTIPAAAFLPLLVQTPQSEIYGCLCPFPSCRLLLIPI